jgi:hypothetical protein
MIEKVNTVFFQLLFKKEFGYYLHFYPTELRRNLSLLPFVCQLMRGSISCPALLNVPIDFLHGRQHEYLVVPASGTNLHWVAPIPRAIRYLNGIITDNSDFYVFRMNRGKLYAIVSSYLSTQFYSNDVEGWMIGLHVRSKRVSWVRRWGRAREYALDFPLLSLHYELFV